MLTHTSPFPIGLRAPALDQPLQRVVAITAFALLTALSAQLALLLPFTPVPITLQGFVVVMAGAWLGGRDGAASQFGYLALGLAGWSVFAAGGGPAYLLGPTGGYLLAFPLAAWLAGTAVPPGSSLARTLAGFTAATLVIFAGGATWLAQSMGIGLDRALALGVVPFLPGEALKIAAAAALAVRR
ncbi:MAG: biotin transporter BioY [Gemmatimonadota bacterium]